MNGVIYALIDPMTKEVRYIGQSFNHVERYKTHCKCIGPKLHSKHWISSLKPLKPIMVILRKDLDYTDIDKEEVEMIRLYKSFGCNLTNHDLGGHSFKVRSAETIEKIRAGNIGRVHSEEEKIKRAASRKLYSDLNRIKVDLEELFRLYITEHMSRKEVANILGVTERTLKRRIQESGIRKR